MKSKYVSSLVRYFPVCRQWCRVSLVWWVTGLSFRSYKGSVHLDDWGNFQSSFRARGFKCTFGPVPIKSGWRVTIYIWVLYWSELVNIQYDKSEGCTRCRNVSGIVCVCVFIYLYIYIYIYKLQFTYIRTHIHTHIHACIHTYPRHVSAPFEIGYGEKLFQCISPYIAIPWTVHNIRDPNYVQFDNNEDYWVWF